MCESHVKVSCFVRPVFAAATTFTAAAILSRRPRPCARPTFCYGCCSHGSKALGTIILGPSVGGDFPSFASYQIECKQYANKGVPWKPSGWVRCEGDLALAGLCLPENAQPSSSPGRSVASHRSIATFSSSWKPAWTLLESVPLGPQFSPTL